MVSGSTSPQIPVSASPTTAVWSPPAKQPFHAQGDHEDEDQMHTPSGGSTWPSPQAGDLGFAGRCSGNSLNHSSNYISAFASGRRDMGPCTSPRHQQEGQW